MKNAFDLYIGRPDYEFFVICHGRNRYEDFVIRHGRNKYLDEDFVIRPQVVNESAHCVLLVHHSTQPNDHKLSNYQLLSTQHHKLLAPLRQGFSNCGPWLPGGPQAIEANFFFGGGGGEFFIVRTAAVKDKTG